MGLDCEGAESREMWTIKLVKGEFIIMKGNILARYT